MDLGLTTQEWEDTREMEAFLSYSFDIKETIEKRPYCTGAQAIQLLYDLKENFCDPEAGLIVRDFPSSLSIQDRELRNDKSTFTTKESDSLCSAVTTAGKVLRDELNARVFHGSSDLRPSNTRLMLGCQADALEGLPAIVVERSCSYSVPQGSARCCLHQPYTPVSATWR